MNGSEGRPRHITADTNEKHSFYGRSSDQDLELWKHHAGFGGEDKNRMVTITSWLLAFSAAILWAQIQLDIVGFWRSIAVSGMGAAISVIARYVTLLYGGYSNQNWWKADKIAKDREWHDLLPEAMHKGTELGVRKNNSSSRAALKARKLAKPCQPETDLAPVFHVFLWLAWISLASHLVFVLWQVFVVLGFAG